MPFNATALQVMIATPSDVPTERQIVRDALNEWNVLHALERGVVLLPLGWETHSAPDLGDRPQAIINKTVLKDADLLVAVFWTRLGSPTGKASSGTVEEIEEHLRLGRPAMLYFSSAPVRPDSVGNDQYTALTTFRRAMEDRGLVESYDSYAEFKDKFQRQLTLTVFRRWGKRDDSPTDQLPPPAVPQAGGGRTAGLSQDAKALLIAAANDAGGTVLQLRTMGGTEVTANGQQFASRGEPRSEARWTAALRKLESKGFIEDRVGKKEVFAVTHAGYTATELLRER